MNKVAIILGSKSDREFMNPAGKELDDLGIPWELEVISAHRQPERLRDYIRRAEDGGVGVFIAAAGLSAALPGFVASHTARPVIGVPVPTGPLGGVDALLSIVQMPTGVPVAAVGLGEQGPGNAALLAARVLALSDAELADKIEQRRKGGG